MSHDRRQLRRSRLGHWFLSSPWPGRALSVLLIVLALVAFFLLAALFERLDERKHKRRCVSLTPHIVGFGR